MNVSRVFILGVVSVFNNLMGVHVGYLKCKPCVMSPMLQEYIAASISLRDA